MPDPTKLLLAMAAAGGVALACVLLLGIPWNKPCPKRSGLGWLLAVAVGFGAGSWMLDVHLKLTPMEVKDRYLAIVLPVALVIEGLIWLTGSTRWWTWVPRFCLAVAMSRVLLDGSKYVSDPTGLNRDKWSTLEEVLVLSALGASIFVVWFALVSLQQRVPGRSVPIAFSIACVAAGVQTMRSGYVEGGQFAVLLGAALAVAALASFAVDGAPQANGALSLAFVLYVGVLIMGKFFGSLPNEYALFWLAAPLLCWLPELLDARPWLRGVGRVVLLLVPFAPVTWYAYEEFRAQGSSPANPYGP